MRARRADGPLSLAGTLTIDADQQMTLEALSAAVGGGGSGAFAGSFAVNVANGEVYAGLRRSEAPVGTLALAAHSTPSLTANAGAISGSGGASSALHRDQQSAQTVRADLTSSTLRAGHNASLGAYQTTTFHGNAISGGGRHRRRDRIGREQHGREHRRGGGAGRADLACRSD